MPICSGTPRLPEFSIDSPVHILHIHGNRDGRIGIATGSRAFDQFALVVNGCTAESRAYVDDASDGNVIVEEYSEGCAADSVFWTASGVGHCPGAAWANYPWLLERQKAGSEEIAPVSDEFNICDFFVLPECEPAPPPAKEEAEEIVEAFSGGEEAAPAPRRWRRFRQFRGDNEEEKSVGDPATLEYMKELIEAANEELGSGHSQFFAASYKFWLRQRKNNTNCSGICMNDEAVVEGTTAWVAAFSARK